MRRIENLQKFFDEIEKRKKELNITDDDIRSCKRPESHDIYRTKSKQQLLKNIRQRIVK